MPRQDRFRFYQHGGPEVLRFEDVETGAPGRGQVRIATRAIAVNYRDVLVRRGTHAVKSFPSGIGVESAGVIDAVGPDVHGLTVGERVACVAGPDSAYAETRIIPAARAVVLPEGIDEQHGRIDDDPRHDGALSPQGDLSRSSPATRS